MLSISTNGLALALLWAFEICDALTIVFGVGSDEPLTTKDAIEVLDKAKVGQANESLPSTKQTNVKRLTVWFNAWKYESTAQVWAGLADAIMRQIADRLSLREREQFWLKLNRSRIDGDRVRTEVYQRVISTAWQSALHWFPIAGGLLFSGLVASLFGHANNVPIAEDVGDSTMVLMLLGSGGLFVERFVRAQREVEKEPASISISKFLDVPAYRKELGFVHEVEQDLRRVLKSVPRDVRPIVVFIDDLDRCSPKKVAEVIEAVNLFLAGDLPDCIFILGMDPEMVASALQSAHKDLIDPLLKDAGVPIGWRFMDKFIQLPFVIPPPSATAVERYRDIVFGAGKAETIVDTPIPSAGEIKGPKVEPQPDSSGVLASEAMRNRIDEGIEQFGDGRSELANAIREATRYFHGNPRELKRFSNAYRFQYFLRWASTANITTDQLIRWTVLLVRWPEVVRWLRRGSAVEVGENANADESELVKRLHVLERSASESQTMSSWLEQVQRQIGLSSNDAPWLLDVDFRNFVSRESQLPQAERLSAGAGKGLW